LLPAFSFFEADEEFAGMIVKKMNGSKYEGHQVNIEITGPKTQRSTRNKPSRNDQPKTFSNKKQGDHKGRSSFGKKRFKKY
jgi:hypothetical protein